MIVQSKSAELEEFAEKILGGVNKALRKLVENAAEKMIHWLSAMEKEMLNQFRQRSF